MADSETQTNDFKNARHEAPHQANLLLEKYSNEEYSDEAANLLIEAYSSALAHWRATDIKDAPN